MGWRKKETKPVPFHGDSSTVPAQRRQMDRSPSMICKLVLYTLFDNSPAGALKLTETNGDDVRSLSTPTPSRKEFSIPQHNPDWLKPDSVDGEQSLREARSLESVKYEVGADEINQHYSLPGSPQDSGGKLFNVFRRRRSKAKGNASFLTSSSQDDSSRDMYYNGDVSESSNSLFDIEVDNDEKAITNPGVVNRLQSEVEVLRRRLEKEEQEVKKLKDEVSFLRSSSSSSQLDSPRSDSSLPSSLHERSVTFSFEQFDTAISPSESSRTSSSDKYDHSDSQRFFEFWPSNGELLKLVSDEQSRSKTYSRQASDPDFVLEKDVKLTRRPSLAKEDLENYCPELMVEHMDTFLSDAATVHGGHGRFENFSGSDYQGIGNQPQEGVGHMVVVDQSSKGNEPCLDVVSIVSEENCCSRDASPLEHAQDAGCNKESGSVHCVLLDQKPFDDTLADGKEDHDEYSNLKEKDNVKRLGDERVKSDKLEEKSEWSSQKFGAQPLKTASIMDCGIPTDPEIAESRRQVQLRYQELEEKLMKILRSPRTDNSRGSPSGSSSSASSSGSSSPRSGDSESPRRSFREKGDSTLKVDNCESYNACSFGSCHPLADDRAHPVNSDLQKIKVLKNPTKDLNLELSSPRDIIFSKFDNLAKAYTLHPQSRAQTSAEEMDTSSSVVGEVHFHPVLSRDLSFSVLTGYRNQRDCGRKDEKHWEDPASCEPGSVSGAVRGSDVWDYGSDADSDNSAENCVRRFLSTGSRRSRFGEEAARLCLQRSCSGRVSLQA